MEISTIGGEVQQPSRLFAVTAQRKVIRHRHAAAGANYLQPESDRNVDCGKWLTKTGRRVAEFRAHFV